MKNIVKSIDNSIKYLKIFRKYISGQSLPDWKKINKSKTKKKILNKKKENILIPVSAGGLEKSLVFESMIGSTLQYEGFNVEYLLCDELLPACIMATNNKINSDDFNKHGSKKICSYCFIRAKNYLETTGAKVLKFSDLISKEEFNQIKKIDFTNLSIDEMKNMKVDDVSVGEHANSGTIRYFASSDFHSYDLAKEIMAKYLRSSIITKKVSENLFKKKKYKELFINHGIYVPQGVILDTAKKFKINTSTWMVGYRRNSIIISRGDTYHRTLIYDNNNKWENIEFTEKHEKKIDSYLKSRWTGSTDWEFYFKNPKFDVDNYFQKNNIDINRPIIGLATNVQWDAQVSFPTNFFSNMLDWLFYTIDFFIKNNHLQLIIRIHPAELNISKFSLQRTEIDIEKKYSKLPNNILIVKPGDNISTYSLFDKCNSVIVYGSKIGSETAATNIPTAVCGESFIRNKNIAIDINSIKEYDKFLNQLPLSKNFMSSEKLQRAKKYAYHFWFRKTMEFKSIYETNIYRGASLQIKKNLFEIYDKKEDPALVETINSIINGTDYILKDEEIIDQNFGGSRF
tara:strand:+ start:896 stop:2605 length:1710 start_codon:yes stop_codon:yes gene_type:complete